MRASSTQTEAERLALEKRQAERDIARLLEANLRLLQIRAKHLSTTDRAELGGWAMECAGVQAGNRQRTLIVINDDAQAAQACGADGVHLGQGDLSPREARSILGPQAIVGLSTHTEQQLLNAPVELLSYVAIGPIFLSTTKRGHAALIGTAELRRRCALTTLPVVAIGGIQLSNAAEVFAAGAQSVAVISELAGTSDPSALVRAYDDAFRATKGSQ